MQHSTTSTQVSKAMRSTSYTLARQIGVAHNMSPYRVLDIVTAVTEDEFPWFRGLTLNNGI